MLDYKSVMQFHAYHYLTLWKWDEDQFGCNSQSGSHRRFFVVKWVYTLNNNYTILRKVFSKRDEHALLSMADPKNTINSLFKARHGMLFMGLLMAPNICFNEATKLEMLVTFSNSLAGRTPLRERFVMW